MDTSSLKSAAGQPVSVKTELGAVALCVTSAVGFLGVAAATKGSFAPVEWWAFLVVGLTWITWFALQFLKVHSYRFPLEEQGKVIDRNRELVRAQCEVVAAQRELIKTIVPYAFAPEMQQAERQKCQVDGADANDCDFKTGKAGMGS